MKSALSAKGVKTAAKGTGRLLATSDGRSITESMVVHRNLEVSLAAHGIWHVGIVGLRIPLFSVKLLTSLPIPGPQILLNTCCIWQAFDPGEYQIDSQ